MRSEAVHIGLDGRVTLRGRVPSGDLAPQSPEECAGRTSDPRADVFGLGAAFVEALTGEPPFRGASSEATERAIQTRSLPALGNDLDAPARKALAKDPAERFETAGDFAVVLERWLTDGGHAAPRAELVRQAVAQRPAELDRDASIAPPPLVEEPTIEAVETPDRPWGLVAGGVLLLAAAVLAAVLFGLD